MSLPFSTVLSDANKNKIKASDARARSHKHYTATLYEKRGWRTVEDWVQDVNEAFEGNEASAKASAQASADMGDFQQRVSSLAEASDERKAVAAQAAARWQEICVDRAERAANAAMWSPSMEEIAAAPVGWRKERREEYEREMKTYEAAKYEAEKARELSRSATKDTVYAQYGASTANTPKIEKPSPPPMERLRVEDVPSLNGGLGVFFDTSGLDESEYVRRLVDPIRIYEGDGQVDGTLKVMSMTVIASLAFVSHKKRSVLRSTGVVPLLCNVVLGGGDDEQKRVASLALRNLNATDAERYGVGGPNFDTPILEVRQAEAVEVATKAEEALLRAQTALGHANKLLEAGESSVAAADDMLFTINPMDTTNRQLANELLSSANALTEPRRNDVTRQEALVKSAKERLDAANAASKAATDKNVASQSFKAPTIEVWKLSIDAKAAQALLDGEGGLLKHEKNQEKFVKSSEDALATVKELLGVAKTGVTLAGSGWAKGQAEAEVARVIRAQTRAENTLEAAKKAWGELQKAVMDAEGVVAKYTKAAGEAADEAAEKVGEKEAAKKAAKKAAEKATEKATKKVDEEKADDQAAKKVGDEGEADGQAAKTIGGEESTGAVLFGPPVNLAVARMLKGSALKSSGRALPLPLPLPLAA